LQYHFDWNPDKEQKNIRKDGMGFQRATFVFRDPNQLSVFDEQHSQDEDRWITIGIDGAGILRVVVHTFEQVDIENVNIRIISARKPTKAEIKQYESK